MQNARILVVEDEGIIAADLTSRLTRMGHSVTGTAANGAKALALAEQTRPDVVLMDIVLQGPINGIETARQLAERSDVPVIYLTSHADDATVRSAVGTEPFGYVLKPFNERELHAAIQIALFKHRTEAKLRKMERWLTATVGSMGDGVIAADREGRVTLINGLAQQLTGWLETEALGRDIDEVFHVVHGATGQPMEGLLERALQEGFSIGVDDDIVLIGRAGQRIAIDDSIAPIRDAAGNATGIVIVFRDGTSRQVAEESLRELDGELQHVLRHASQLEESNRALDAFCLSVAHDLRTPLFALNGFSGILADRYASLLDEQGQSFLGLIQKASQQMDRLVTDYLRLARLRHAPLTLVEIDSDALVREVADELASQHPAARDIIFAGPLPKACADEGLLRQVWANLLGNALKFSSRRALPMVEVSGEATPQEARFRVRDNGIGFDQGQADRMFGMFQRLQAGGDFAGFGIGLATVSTIVRRHGGTIRAEGDVDRGATFHFTLPAVPPAPATRS